MPIDLNIEAKLEALAFLKEKPFVAAIKNACIKTGRQFDATPWPEGEIVPLGGDVEIAGHTPLFIVNNILEWRKGVPPYQAPGYTAIVKYGERQYRGQEAERKVTVSATICQDQNGPYVFVCLFSTDGRSHENGRQVYTFDSRLRVGLQAWISEMLIFSESDLPEPKQEALVSVS